MNMIRALALIAIVAVPLAGANLALAHGPQLQVTVSGSQLQTGNIFLDEPYSATPTEMKSVYVMQINDYNGAWFTRPNQSVNGLSLPNFYSGPGINYGLASANLAAGSNISMSFTDGLKLWNGAAFVDPGVEQLQAFRGSDYTNPSASATTTDSGPFAGLIMATTSGSDTSQSHSTVRFRLDAGGSTPQDGVYLLGMQLSTNSAGIANSDPYYFVMSKNADPAAIDAAVASLGFPSSAVQVVPEPAAILLAALATPLACWSIRRRSRRS